MGVLEAEQPRTIANGRCCSVAAVRPRDAAEGSYPRSGTRGVGSVGRPPNRRRTPVHARRMAAVDQSSSLWAHWNSRAKIARPIGTTTTLVPGTGTTRRATPNVRTPNPATAMATRRSPTAPAAPRCPGRPTRPFAISLRRICMSSLCHSFFHHGATVPS